MTFLVSQGDRYLGMTAAMTQIPVPTANIIIVKYIFNLATKIQIKVYVAK